MMMMIMMMMIMIMMITWSSHTTLFQLETKETQSTSRLFVGECGTGVWVWEGGRQVEQ